MEETCFAKFKPIPALRKGKHEGAWIIQQKMNAELSFTSLYSGRISNFVLSDTMTKWALTSEDTADLEY